QKQIAAETSARQPRGYFNVVQGDSGLAQPATPRADTVASFESDTDAFLRILAPSIEEKGIAFATPESLADGGIVYLGTDVMQFRTNGNITRMSLGADGTLSLQTLGTAGATAVCRNASNQFASCSSSARYKEGIEDLGLGLAAAMQLRPVGYRWKETQAADVGFVAEEVAQLDERLVTRNAEGWVEGVKYDRLTAVLAGAVQELAAREELQRQELDRLRAEMRELKDLVRSIRARER
ncbi:MAG: tail fiber domain-containing protein, partial [Rhodanobacteraceae bacterium]|nr:tail fiber domain-containing protein [Rhodanobacteraceae bacterium]